MPLVTKALAVAVTVSLLWIPAIAQADPAQPVGSNPQTEKDYLSLSSQLDDFEASYIVDSSGEPQQTKTITIAEVMALVPQSVFDFDPALAGLIQGAAPIPEPSPVSHSGPLIPGCPNAGWLLLGGFPPPYGHFATSRTNNWCAPNGDDDGCTYVPDNGLTFDFRAACRQHDLAYDWAPVPPSERRSVDNLLYRDMKADCAKRNFASKLLCYPRAAIMYAAVVVFGEHAYANNTNWPGYNLPTPVRPLLPAPTCNQNTHAFVYTAGQGNSPRRGTQIYLTGVVRKSSRILFEFRDSAGSLVATHLTYFADNNCVVRHEAEAFAVNRLPIGIINVHATTTRWEDNQTVTQQVATLDVREGGGTTTCGQPTHVWIYGNNGPLPQGRFIYLTGVVRRYTPIVFKFYNTSGALVAVRQTAAAQSNCVVHHEPEWFSTASLAVGTYVVDATYVEWESDRQVTTRAGTLTIIPPSGGGGGGGGGCPIAPVRQRPNTDIPC